MHDIWKKSSVLVERTCNWMFALFWQYIVGFSVLIKSKIPSGLFIKMYGYFNRWIVLMYYFMVSKIVFLFAFVLLLHLYTRYKNCFFFSFIFIGISLFKSLFQHSYYCELFIWPFISWISWSLFSPCLSDIWRI